MSQTHNHNLFHAIITYMHMHITPFPNVERKVRKQGMSKYVSEWINGTSEGVNERIPNAFMNGQVWE